MNLTARNWLQRKVAIVNGVTESSGVVHAVEPVDSPRLLPLKLSQKTAPFCQKYRTANTK